MPKWHGDPETVARASPVPAAVAPIGAPGGPYPGLLQDWPQRARSGLLGCAAPMTHTSRVEKLRGPFRWAVFLLEACPGRPCVARRHGNGPRRMISCARRLAGLQARPCFLGAHGSPRHFGRTKIR